MGQSRTNELLKKYYLAETSNKEEMELADLIQGNELDNSEESAIFKFYKKERDSEDGADFVHTLQQGIQNQKSGLRKRTFMRTAIAASLLLMFSIGVIVKINQNQQAQLAKMQSAYEQTKDALSIVSTYLNQGTSELSVISKFDKNMQYLKYFENMKSSKLDAKLKTNEL